MSLLLQIIIYLNIILLFFANGLTNDEIQSHSFAIHLYDNYLEINIALMTNYGSELQYSSIITKQDCIYKYKILSLDLLTRNIGDAIDDDIDESIASYKIKLLENNDLELIISFNDGIKDNAKKIKLIHLPKALSQETKVINHLEEQIYDLRKKTKILKSMIVPKTGIIIWTKCNEIPKGFVICDGDNNSPDLRHMFIINDDEIIDDKQPNCDENDDNQVCQSDAVQTYDTDNIYYDLCYIMKS